MHQKLTFNILLIQFVVFEEYCNIHYVKTHFDKTIYICTNYTTFEYLLHM